MTVTPEVIAKALGRPAPSAGSADAEQWSMWIDDALLLIEARLGDPAALDQRKLDYVVREAAVAQVRKPEDYTNVTVSVDDGSTSKTYQSGKGRVTILDEWWDLLSPAAAGSGAFAVDTVGVVINGHADICALNFGAMYCSCGAVLTQALPLYERSW
jgi:hypothetical protein